MKCLVAGAGGFIGGHLVDRLMAEGHDVRAVDIKPIGEWWQSHIASNRPNSDLRLRDEAFNAVRNMDAVYNLACDMGGIGFIETHKTDCMVSVLINTHLLMAANYFGVERYFYSSSACVYHADRQNDPDVTALCESDAYYNGGAMPEDGYGWEKLFSERMCRHFREDRRLETRVARFHNIFGPHGSWCDGREKAPAALCRKVAEAKRDGRDWIDVWGDGTITRSFCWIDDCVDGILRLTESDVQEPLNIGSSELVTVNGLIDVIEAVADYPVRRVCDTSQPQGVAGRNSDNTLCRAVLGWEPTTPLSEGIARTFPWIEEQVRK